MSMPATTLKNTKGAAMNILDKFSSVEIKADNRISDADRDFCVRHQEAFDKAGPALGKIAEAIIAAKTDQQAILGNDGNEYSYLSPWGVYISSDGFKCDESAVYEIMKKRSERFITGIVDYFQRKYTLVLDEDKIKENLIPTPPKEPKLPWGGYRSMTEEEVDTFEEKLATHKAELQKYEDELRVHPLRYEQIVDEIFVQLGGFSFEERAMNEFLQRTWDACHYTCDYPWNNIKAGDERFEIKNAVLRLPNGCSCDENKWMTYPVPKYRPTEDLVTLLDALAWYQCGRINEGPLWFPKLGNRWSSTEENVIYTQNMSKVDSIKLFKNGRVDIKFRSATYLQEFVEQCMRRQSVS